jgi:hypothetical protein
MDIQIFHGVIMNLLDWVTAWLTACCALHVENNKMISCQTHAEKGLSHFPAPVWFRNKKSPYHILMCGNQGRLWSFLGPMVKQIWEPYHCLVLNWRWRERVRCEWIWNNQPSRRLHAPAYVMIALHGSWSQHYSKCASTYKSSCFVVVEIDSRLDIPCLFSWVEKWLGEVDTEVQVVRTTSPLPSASSSLLWGHVEALGAFAAQAEPRPMPIGNTVARRIAPASHQLPHAACPGHAMRHAGRWNCVGKSRLAIPWQTQTAV